MWITARRKPRIFGLFVDGLLLASSHPEEGKACLDPYGSPRNPPSFLKVNCASLPAELLESELFGHEKGAFTGAHRRKPGKFELAHRGTFLLDEIGEMPLPLQAKLLHVLQDGQFFRVGVEKVKWNRAEAARLLKISYKAMLYKIRQMGLDDRHERGLGRK